MMGRWKWVVIFAAIAVIAYLVWQEFKLPDGVEPMGDDTNETIATLAFYTACATAAGSFFKMLQEFFALFKKSGDK